MGAIDPALFVVDNSDLDGFICRVCQMVVTTAAEPTLCKDKHLFCRNCIIPLVSAHNHLCPVDGASVQPTDLILALQIGRSVSQFLVKCSHHSSGKSLRVVMGQVPGCRWRGSPDELQSHLLSCDYRLVECPRCEQKIQFRARRMHDIYCLNVEQPCSACGLNVPLRETDSHHDVCEGVCVPCPNMCLKDRKYGYNSNSALSDVVFLPRGDIEKHRAVCPFEETQCPFEAVGCMPKDKLTRAQLVDHIASSTQTHMHLLLQTIGSVVKVSDQDNMRKRKRLNGSVHSDEYGSIKKFKMSEFDSHDLQLGAVTSDAEVEVVELDMIPSNRPCPEMVVDCAKLETQVSALQKQLCDTVLSLKEQLEKDSKQAERDASAIANLENFVSHWREDIEKLPSSLALIHDLLPVRAETSSLSARLDKLTEECDRINMQCNMKYAEQERAIATIEMGTQQKGEKIDQVQGVVAGLGEKLRVVTNGLDTLSTSLETTKTIMETNRVKCDEHQEKQSRDAAQITTEIATIQGRISDLNALDAKVEVLKFIRDDVAALSTKLSAHEESNRQSFESTMEVFDENIKAHKKLLKVDMDRVSSEIQSRGRELEELVLLTRNWQDETSQNVQAIIQRLCDLETACDVLALEITEKASEVGDGK